MYIAINSKSSYNDKTSGKLTYIDEKDYDLNVSTEKWNPWKGESHPWHITVTGQGIYNIGTLVDRHFQINLTPNDIQKLLDELSLRGLLSTKVLLTKPIK